MPHRADRGVRPYRTLCVFAENAYNFAIALCRVDVGIDPYGQVALSVFVVRICWCIPRGRGRTPPLRLDWEHGQNLYKREGQAPPLHYDEIICHPEYTKNPRRGEVPPKS